MLPGKNKKKAHQYFNQTCLSVTDGSYKSLRGKYTSQHDCLNYVSQDVMLPRNWFQEVGAQNLKANQA